MIMTVPKINNGAYRVDARALRFVLETPGEKELFQTLMAYIDRSGEHAILEGNIGVVTSWRLSDGEIKEVVG